MGWGETESTSCTSATNWPVVPGPDDRWGWSNWWHENWHGKPKFSEETYPRAILSIINLAWLELGSNPRCRGGKPATNRLSYGTALMHDLLIRKILWIYSEETYSRVIVSITNLTWLELGSNPGCRGGKPATNRLSYGTALMHDLLIRKILWIYSEETYSRAIVSITNLTWLELGSNPGCRGGKPATNRLSYGTAKRKY
jgi:hypothetical protein